MGCPVCAGQKIVAGINDLATLRPELAREALFDATTIAVRSGKKLPWKCAEGHVWEAVVAARSVGVGCPFCAQHGYSYAKPGWLYLLRHDSLDLMQFGISNVPESRLATHQAGGWDVIDLRGPMDGVLAAEWERAFLRLMRKKKLTTGQRLGVDKFTGYTEAWPVREYEVQSVHELMEAVERAEDEGVL